MAKENFSEWSREELIREVRKLGRRKYGLVWEDKPEIVAELCKTKLPVLVEDTSKEISGNVDKPANILIEGDNYHALSVLSYTHKGMIDVIYIDPPYNTGNNTWKYNNSYVDEEDQFRHSKWLSFMQKRLKLAKDLLAKDGVMCVTIDNNEVHNLKHLLEKLFFGKEIIMTVIEHNHRGRAKQNFALTHEYALWVVPKDTETISRLNEKSEDIQRNLRRTGQDSGESTRPTMFYGIEVNKKTLEIISVTEPIDKGSELPKAVSEDTELVFPIDKDGVRRRWYYSPETVLSEVEEGNVWAKIIDGRIEIHYWQAGKEKRRKSVWIGPKFDSSTYGSELLTEIIGNNDFPFPKSLYAVMECISASSEKKDAIVLDFFAGSGTTGHAVLELNKADQGNRSFILCTNNENGICEQITYPRIKNVINGYGYKGKIRESLLEQKVTASSIYHQTNIVESIEETKQNKRNQYDFFELKVENNQITLYGVREKATRKEGLGGNLKYFRPDFVEAVPTDYNKKVLTEKCTEMLCLKEGCFRKVKEGPHFRTFESHQGKNLGIVYDDEGIEPLKEEIKKLKRKFVVYVFSLDESAREEEFDDIRNFVSLKPIPSVILNVYKRIFK
jgi:adenine-specific DNA-methyltransferase